MKKINSCQILVHVVLQQFMTFINILLIDILSMQWFLSDTRCLYTTVNILYILCFRYLAEIYFSTSKCGFELRYCISECAHSWTSISGTLISPLQWIIMLKWFVSPNRLFLKYFHHWNLEYSDISKFWNSPT